MVRFAGQNGLKVAGQGTGHGAVALGPLEDAILIKTERMRGVEVDADAQTARVEAGVLALELGEAAQAQGLCSLPGSSPDVGVDRLHARRRPELARAAPRLRLQPGDARSSW